MFRIFAACVIALGIALTAQAGEPADKKATRSAQSVLDASKTKTSATADKSARAKAKRPVSVKKVKRGKADRIVVYSATWCRPCRRLKPVLLMLQNEGYRVTYRDVDKDRKKLNYDFKSVPTIFYVRNNEVIRKETGFHSGREIKSKLRIAQRRHPVEVILRNTKTAITTDIVLEGLADTLDVRGLISDLNPTK
jgi:thiol-disulfide isomerase/thioredoxin